MASNFSHSPDHSNHPDWRAAGLRYYTYPFFLKNRFGHRVQRISLDGGFSCPNVDGRVAQGGCIFCNNDSFSPSRRLTEPDIPRQIDAGIRRVQRKYKNCQHFLAYFQPGTNTYGPVPKLYQLYQQALADPRIVGLAVGTRPDCVPDEVLDLLAELARQTYVSVEYGVQTMHDPSLAWIHRGHNHAATVDAMTRSRHRGLDVGAHVILGIPGESLDQMQATGRELARFEVDAVKIHNLYAVQGTRLAQQVLHNELALIDRSTYVTAVVNLLEVLPPHTVVQRLCGDAPSEYLVAPDWCQDKMGVRQAIDAELEHRDTWQGRWFARADTERP